MPVVRPVATSPGADWEQYASTFSHANETASPGYYRVKLDSGVEAELTTTPRTGMGRFTFPPNSPATLLIRANGSIAVNGNDVSGYADSKLRNGRPYRVYFFARFVHPIKSSKTWTADQINEASTAEGKSCGAILSFDASTDSVVSTRVGISYTSAENAEENLSKENASLDFSDVRGAAEKLGMMP